MSINSLNSSGRKSLRDRMGTDESIQGMPEINPSPIHEKEFNLDPTLDKGDQFIQQGKVSEGLDLYALSNF